MCWGLMQALSTLLDVVGDLDIPFLTMESRTASDTTAEPVQQPEIADTLRPQPILVAGTEGFGVCDAEGNCS